MDKADLAAQFGTSSAGARITLTGPNTEAGAKEAEQLVRDLKLPPGWRAERQAPTPQPEGQGQQGQGQQGQGESTGQLSVPVEADARAEEAKRDAARGDVKRHDQRGR